MEHKPLLSVLAEVQVDPSHLDEFMRVTEEDAKKSREEPGCVSVAIFCRSLFGHIS